MRRLATVLLGAILVAGCGGSATPTPAPTTETPAPTDLVNPTEKPTATASNEPSGSPSVESPGPTKSPSGNRKYKIKAGDTFYKIAKKYGITVDALQAANPRIKPNALPVGGTLIIPPKK